MASSDVIFLDWQSHLTKVDIINAFHKFVVGLDATSCFSIEVADSKGETANEIPKVNGAYMWVRKPIARVLQACNKEDYVTQFIGIGFKMFGGICAGESKKLRKLQYELRDRKGKEISAAKVEKSILDWAITLRMEFVHGNSAS